MPYSHPEMTRVDALMQELDNEMYRVAKEHQVNEVCQMIDAIRSMPNTTAPAPVATPRVAVAPTAPQRAAARPATPATLPPVIDGNARFDPSHMAMKPASPQLDSVKDSYVFSPGSTIRQR